jgi:transcriptional regulator with XRE-family HTH domain
VEAGQGQRVGDRIRQARQEAGLTQAQLASLLGITTRSVQNYESGAITPWRHLGRIETLTRKRHGWLLSSDGNAGSLDADLADLAASMEQHYADMRDHLRVLRENTDQLRRQLDNRERARAEPSSE